MEPNAAHFALTLEASSAAEVLRRTAAELDRLGEVEVLALSGQSYMEYGGDFVFTVVVTLAGGEE